MKSKDHKINGLKSHDSQILLEQLLPLAIHGVVSNNVYDAITELSIFSKSCVLKTLRVGVLDQLEAQVRITLNKLEKLFL